jgi:hypothetical protein
MKTWCISQDLNWAPLEYTSKARPFQFLGRVRLINIQAERRYELQTTVYSCESAPRTERQRVVPGPEAFGRSVNAKRRN